MTNNLRLIREWRGYSQQMVADAIGTYRIKIHRLEINESPLRETIAQQLAALYGVTTDDLTKDNWRYPRGQYPYRQGKRRRLRVTTLL